MASYNDLGVAPRAAIARDDTRTVFGQVMGLVAITVGCAALRRLHRPQPDRRHRNPVLHRRLRVHLRTELRDQVGHEQLAIGLLFGLGLLIGLAVAPVLAYYAKSNPSALWQAAGATGAFVAALGAFGYATSRDLSSWARTLFWALLALIVFGIVAIFVSIPHANVIYCVLGLVIFGGFTIFDFNRLRRANMASAVPIAAGIFLDIFNVFLLLLRLFGGGRN
jgi:FtsH-binding integral membrane protein